MSPDHRPNDGTIDFSGYTLQQLDDFRSTIDRNAFPQNYANLLGEIERRQAQEAQPSTPEPAPGEAIPGRFTSRDGLRGWLQAKRNWRPLYGAGSMEVTPPYAVMRGHQRTWLGIPMQAEVNIPLTRIRNVRAEGERLRFEIKRRALPARTIELTTESPQHAAALAARLPQTQSRGFEKRWSEITDFNRRLAAVSSRPWITWALILANIVLFAAMAVVAGQPGGFAPPTYLAWGANYGPLTVNGEWWRLFTALFVHFNVLHVLVNMWALWGVGRLTERLYGRWVYAFVYLAAGGLASLTSIAWNPGITSIGASGAVFGVFGAFLAFLASNRRTVPTAIVRAHWKSTAVFVLFNLISGGLQNGIDNAAHVGGLIAGAIVGWIMARPLEIEQRRGFPALRSAGAVAFIAAVVLAAFWQVRGHGAQLTPYEEFGRQNAWYIEGETRNLQTWQQLAQRAAAGTISSYEFSESFRQQIVPFWRDAHERLTRQESVPAEQKAIYALVSEFVDLRLRWSQALVEATRNNDQERAQESVRLMGETAMVQARIDRAGLHSRLEHRPRALATSPAVMKVRALLPWNKWNCVKGPAWIGYPAPTDSITDGPARRHAAACEAQRLFMAGDYESLDELMKRHTEVTGDLPDGGSTIAGIYSGLSDLFEYGGLQVDDVLGRVTDWRRAVKGSIDADLVETVMFQDWAWAARGHGSASQVSPQQWALFAHRIEMAAASLRETEPHAQKSPIWHALSIDIALDKSLPLEEIRAAFDRGAKLFPDYYPLHRRMLRVLMPRWLGSQEKVDGFINEISVREDGSRDFAKYAELYWAYQGMERDDLDIFKGGRADWDAVKRGFTELMERRPQSDYLLNAFARLACQASDWEQYEALRPQVEKRMSSTAWSEKRGLASCDAAMRKTTSKRAHERPEKNTEL